MQSGRIRSGLVSVTFRAKPVAEIVALAATAKLAGIEWGGDVHVSPGDIAAADDARQRTLDAGLVVIAYGSYYRAAASKPDEFGAVLETAVRLGAPTIRIWAGTVGSAAADAAHVARVRSDVARVCDLAGAAGVTVTLEYHGNTLTDTLATTLSLLRAIDRPNLRTGWQPRDGLSAEAGVDEIRQLRPWLGNVHVFQWWPTGATRHPLADGRERWAAYLAAAAEDGRERFALLEFVKGDAAEQFVKDAAVLRELL